MKAINRIVTMKFYEFMLLPIWNIPTYPWVFILGDNFLKHPSTVQWNLTKLFHFPHPLKIVEEKIIQPLENSSISENS